MKCACLAILICFVTLKGLSQNVTISERNIPLGKMMNIIRKQTGYYFSFSTGITGEVTNVSLNVKNKPLQAALDILFSKLPYTYLLKGKFILIVERKNNKADVPLLFAFSGIVETENGEPLEGATILILNSKKCYTTNSAGQFTINDLPPNTTLQISSIGYETKQVLLNNQNELKIKLQSAASGLDEAVVVGYGKTSRRLNAGTVDKVKGSEIIDQPVPNFLAALASRVPGMVISQVNGIPGAAYKAQIQGQSSIEPNIGAYPAINLLFIVDGVPYAPNNNNLPTLTASATLGDGRSSFDLINITDIESIELLKDADATAIYGSRGANGVVLITTKKGIIGKNFYKVSVNTGVGRITRYPDMMNTEQYLQMRRIAITNDGNTPGVNNAPDLFKWDTTRYTDFKKSMIGGTARTTNAYFSIEGGKKLISYLFSTSFRKQTTVFPGEFNENTFFSHGNFQYKSLNNRLATGLNFLATHDDNLSPSRDMTTFVNLPPTAPAFYDSTGELVLQHKGFAFNNPMAVLIQPYRGITNNMLINFNSSYKITNELAFKINSGINNISSKESLLQPRRSFNTFSNPNAIATSYFANTKLKSWILEPQVEYNSHVGKGKISVLIGSTYQKLVSRNTNQTGYFPNDSVINDIHEASTLKTTPNNSVYKYVGLFVKVGYTWLDKYIINFTGRRDGSSRFGVGKQFGNFGAVGAAWIFSKEPVINKKVPYLSFGKFRTSYGVTGSDQIGDYQYLDQWIQSTNTYQGISGIIPINPANPYYSWEENKKLSFGTELGFFNDKLLLSTDYYRNRTGNQIITVSLPGTTGFDRLLAGNYPAVVQNTGWEFIFQINSIKRKDYNLSSRIVFTIPKNKLLSFPKFSNSQYVNKDIKVGHSLSSNSGLTFDGIDKNTGLFTFKDFDNDGALSYPNDYSVVTNRDPKYYGSLLNKFRYKNIEVEFLTEFKNQISYNYLRAIYQSKPPGGRFNQPSNLNDYWKKPGDQPQIQKLTASTSSEAYDAIQNYLMSNEVFSNSSYIKIKYAALSIRLSKKVLQKLHLKECRFYLSSNNLAIFTPFKATDPETIDTFTLPPLRTISAGIQTAF